MRDGLWAGAALSNDVATDWRTAKSRLLAVGDKTGWLSSQNRVDEVPLGSNHIRDRLSIDRFRTKDDKVHRMTGA